MESKMTYLADNEYRCLMCNIVYQYTDFDAAAELKTNFPEHEGELCGTVCDDCYRALLERIWLMES